MKCNGCGVKLESPGVWTHRNTEAAIAAGWKMWFSQRDQLGDKSMREGDVRCPNCFRQVDPAAIPAVTGEGE